MNEFILTVDPGVYTMGACLWRKDEWYDKDIIAFPCGTMSREFNEKQRKEIEAHESMAMLLQNLTNWFNHHKIVQCYCEKPQVFNSAVGYAANQKGFVGQMEMFRGMLCGYCMTKGCSFHDVLVTKWKGQLNKTLVKERLKSIFWEHNNHVSFACLHKHSIDACGIGFYLQGIKI